MSTGLVISNESSLHEVLDPKHKKSSITYAPYTVYADILRRASTGRPVDHCLRLYIALPTEMTAMGGARSRLREMSKGTHRRRCRRTARSAPWPAAARSPRSPDWSCGKRRRRRLRIRPTRRRTLRDPVHRAREASPSLNEGAVKRCQTSPNGDQKQTGICRLIRRHHASDVQRRRVGRRRWRHHRLRVHARVDAVAVRRVSRRTMRGIADERDRVVIGVVGRRRRSVDVRRNRRHRFTADNVCNRPTTANFRWQRAVALTASSDGTDQSS